MWPFDKEPTKADLQAHRKVSLGGYKFIIRRVNPLLDFEPDRMPQIFKAPSLKDRNKANKPLKPAEAKKMMEDMVAVLEAGVVSPELVPTGRGSKQGSEEGITAQDILRWDDVGADLYTEIISWSLVQYRGLRGAIQFSANKAAMLDAVAKRYSVRPSDLVFGDSEASEADRQFVDLHAANHGAAAEKKATAEAKK